MAANTAGTHARTRNGKTLPSASPLPLHTRAPSRVHPACWAEAVLALHPPTEPAASTSIAISHLLPCRFPTGSVCRQTRASPALAPPKQPEVGVTATDRPSGRLTKRSPVISCDGR